VEERLVLVRRLILAEEIRLRLGTQDEAVFLPVGLRRQSVVVERLADGEDIRPFHDTGAPDMTQHTLLALFDSHADAERAAEALRGLNVRASGVSVQVGETARLPDEDRAIWQEAMRRGGALLRADVAEDDMELAMDAMEAAGAVDLDERAQAWKAQGWTDATTSGAAAGATRPQAATTKATKGATSAKVDRDTTATPARNPTGHEESIPLAEERLRVGKRLAQSGRVRVRAYTVETPVEEQVRLREEHVRVERHAADRPATGDEALFRDRVIEAQESSEEAVVQKETRITGEVVVNKETTERTETVRDTVRRTEVEVDEQQAANDPKRRGGKGAA
jgi:uncharacterized protein (TIGR02271 family)